MQITWNFHSIEQIVQPLKCYLQFSISLIIFRVMTNQSEGPIFFGTPCRIMKVCILFFIVPNIFALPKGLKRGQAFMVN